MKCREVDPGVFPAGAGMIPHGIHWLRQVCGAFCKCRGALVEGTAGKVAECFLRTEIFPSHRTRDAHAVNPQQRPSHSALKRPTTSRTPRPAPLSPQPRCLCREGSAHRHERQGGGREAQREHDDCEHRLACAGAHEGGGCARHRDHRVAAGCQRQRIARAHPAENHGEELAANPAARHAERVDEPWRRRDEGPAGIHRADTGMTKPPAGIFMHCPQAGSGQSKRLRFMEGMSCDVGMVLAEPRIHERREILVMESLDIIIEVNIGTGIQKLLITIVYIVIKLHAGFRATDRADREHIMQFTIGHFNQSLSMLVSIYHTGCCIVGIRLSAFH